MFNIDNLFGVDTCGTKRSSKRCGSPQQQIVAPPVQALSFCTARRRRTVGRKSSLSKHHTHHCLCMQLASMQQSLMCCPHSMQQIFTSDSNMVHSTKVRAFRQRMRLIKSRRVPNLLQHMRQPTGDSSCSGSYSSSKCTVLAAEGHHLTGKAARTATAKIPSLTMLTVVVRKLLQLAIVRASPAIAAQLQKQLPQQIKAAAVVANYQQVPFSVAAEVHAALPGLRASVKQACKMANERQQQQIQGQAEAIPPASCLVPSSPISSSSSSAVTSTSSSSIISNPALALEAALTAAACEVKLSCMYIAAGASSCGLLHDAGSDTSTRSSSRGSFEHLDMDAFLQTELVAALLEHD